MPVGMFPRAVTEEPGEVVTSPLTAGSRAAPTVPLEMFEAFVVSVVAEAGNATPLVLVTVITPVLGTSVRLSGLGTSGEMKEISDGFR
jgi:hypothetical protein